MVTQLVRATSNSKKLAKLSEFEVGQGKSENYHTVFILNVMLVVLLLKIFSRQVRPIYWQKKLLKPCSFFVKWLHRYLLFFWSGKYSYYHLQYPVHVNAYHCAQQISLNVWSCQSMFDFRFPLCVILLSDIYMIWWSGVGYGGAIRGWSGNFLM